MTKIIEFPGGKERYQREIEKIFDESLRISDPKLKECIKSRVSKTLSTQKGIPAFNITVPIELSDSDTKILTDALSAEYNNKVSEFAREFIGEICILQAELCKWEHGAY